jgi:hypothetical protein
MEYKHLRGAPPRGETSLGGWLRRILWIATDVPGVLVMKCIGTKSEGRRTKGFAPQRCTWEADKCNVITWKAGSNNVEVMVRP